MKETTEEDQVLTIIEEQREATQEIKEKLWVKAEAKREINLEKTQLQKDLIKIRDYLVVLMIRITIIQFRMAMDKKIIRIQILSTKIDQRVDLILIENSNNEITNTNTNTFYIFWGKMT